MIDFDPTTTPYDKAILIQRHQSGQARPYADSIYDYSITFTGKDIAVKSFNPFVVSVIGSRPSAARVKEVAKVLVNNFYEKEEAPHAFAPILESLEVEDEGPGYTTWRIKIVERYDD